MIRLEMSETYPARRGRQPLRRVGYGLLQQNRSGYCERIGQNSGAGQQLFKADAVAGPWPVLWSVCLGQYGNDGQRFFVNGVDRPPDPFHPCRHAQRCDAVGNRCL